MNPAREGEAPAEPTPFRPRRHPAHGVNIAGHDPIIIFLTVCTKARQPWLATPSIHNLLRDIWTQADAWLVGQYVLMPDHLHLFAAPNPRWESKSPREGEAPAEPPVFDAWVRYWKSQFTKRHNTPSHRWQTDHWERRLRREENSADKWAYVRNNPVRHGLVAKSDNWPHQGKIADLIW